MSVQYILIEVVYVKSGEYKCSICKKYNANKNRLVKECDYMDFIIGRKPYYDICDECMYNLTVYIDNSRIAKFRNCCVYGEVNIIYHFKNCQHCRQSPRLQQQIPNRKL